MAGWSIAVPLYEAPDEPAHVDLVMNAAAGNPYPAFDQEYMAVAVLEDCHQYIATTRWCPTDATRGQPSPQVKHQVADAPDRQSGGTYASLGGPVRANRWNQLAQHPFLYYDLMGAVVSVERAMAPVDWPLAREVALLRGVNLLLVAPMPLLAWGAARRLRLRPHVAATASLLPLAIPQLTHIGSTVNNDNLLILFGGVAIALAAGVIQGDRSWRTAILIGITCGLAMLTKSTGFVFPVLAGLAYAAAAWAHGPAGRRDASGAALRLVTVAALTAAVAGWWYLRNWLEYRNFVPSIDASMITEKLQPPGFSPDLGYWSGQFVSRIVPRFWGWFGAYSVRMTSGLTVIATVFGGALIAIGLLTPPERARHRRATPTADRSADGDRPVRRLFLWILLSPAALLLAFVAARAWSLYARSSTLPFIQGRYVFPAMAAVAVVFAVGAHRVFRRWAAAVIVGWALIMQVDGLRAVLAGYWSTPGSGIRDQIAAVEAWSRWPTAAVVLLAVLAMLAVAGLITCVAMGMKRPQVTPVSGTQGG